MISLSLRSSAPPTAFQRRPVRPSAPRYRGFSLAKDSSTGFWSTARDSKRPFRTRFRCGSPPEGLTSPRAVTRGLIMQKACRNPVGPRHLVGTRFQVCFTPLTGVLFTFPSRYWFAIGHRLVFSLGGWAPRIRTGFHVSRPTWDPAGVVCDFGYRALTVCGRPFQAVPLSRSNPVSRSRNPARQAGRFGLLRVRSPLLAKSLLFSLPPGTEMFHFPGCRARGLWIDPSSTGIAASGLPHSEIHGSKRVGRSPWLIAASRVLRRLAMPRHPPHARQRLRGQSRPRTRLQTRGAPGARRSLRHSSGLWKNRFACQRSKGVGTCHCATGGWWA